MGNIEAAMLFARSVYVMLLTRSPYARTLVQSSSRGVLAYTRFIELNVKINFVLGRTKPRPGRLTLFNKWGGNNAIIGINESSSIHNTFKAGSQNALQVRAKRETERLPPGASMMTSRSFCVTSASLRIVGNIVC
jgi:curved DNA-binding protein CbpA